VSILLKGGRREPVGMARCVSLCSLAVFAYEELTYFEPNAPERMHSKIRDALLVILQALRVSLNARLTCGLSLFFLYLFSFGF
jgi:hypothetical protein